MDGVVMGLLANLDTRLLTHDREIKDMLRNFLFNDFVDLSNATEDYLLAEYSIAYISFTNVTQVPLHISTPNNSYYELHVIPSNTGGTSGGTDGNVFLYPNNTTYSDAFYSAEIWRDASALNSSYPQNSAFVIGRAFSAITAWITNRTQYKNVRALLDYYGISNTYPALRAISSDWRDTSTAWTSLGTIVFPQATSGEILVFRAR